MRLFKILLIGVLLFVIFELPQARSVKITIDCADIEYFEIRKTRPGVHVFGNVGCEYDCFYAYYYLEDSSAQAFDNLARANDGNERSLYIDDYLLYVIPPAPAELKNMPPIPYARQILFPGMYANREELVATITHICPDVPVKRRPGEMPQPGE